MQKIDAILNHPLYLAHMAKNAESELNRQFCKHDLTHALDVARIMQLMNLEQSLSLEKPLLYAAALLHDITKWQQYKEKTPHNETAVIPATMILQEVGFLQEDIALITHAIYHHRRGTGNTCPYAKILFEADKKSRNCFSCTAGDTCTRSNTLKNLTLQY